MFNPLPIVLANCPTGKNFGFCTNWESYRHCNGGLNARYDKFVDLPYQMKKRIFSVYKLIIYLILFKANIPAIKNTKDGINALSIGEKP